MSSPEAQADPRPDVVGHEEREGRGTVPARIAQPESDDATRAATRLRHLCGLDGFGGVTGGSPSTPGGRFFL